MIFPTPGYASMTAQILFSTWIDAAAKHDTFSHRPDDEWIRRFREAGPHLTEIVGGFDERRTGATNAEILAFAWGGIERIAGVGQVGRDAFAPPAHLYRAASPGHSNRLMWFDDYRMAKLLADHRVGTTIYTADADEVFGKVVMDRTEPDGYRHVWNEWIVKPKNVRAINRWRDPFAPGGNVRKWEKRGVHVDEAVNIVNGWTGYHKSELAPTDREADGYWLSEFRRIGKFKSRTHYDENNVQIVEVQPVDTLTPPPILYRGSSERLNTRLSWTDSPDTALEFIRTFSPDDGQVWVCQPEEVLNVMRFEMPRGLLARGYELVDFTEWITIPDKSSIRLWDGSR
jgi:hypothetical protein